MRRKMSIYKCMLNVYKNQQNRQTGSRNLMDPKMLPTIWGTYMKLVTKYQISAINSCWEKCEEKWAYMFDVYVRFLFPVCRLSWFLYTLNIYVHFSSHFSQQLLMAEIWYLVTSFIWTDRGKTVYPPPPSGSGGIKRINLTEIIKIYSINWTDN
jgi:hypothetical protein